MNTYRYIYLNICIWCAVIRAPSHRNFLHAYHFLIRIHIHVTSRTVTVGLILIVCNSMCAFKCQSCARLFPLRVHTYSYHVARMALLIVCTHTHMQWLRWVDSFRLWVSFAEYSLFYRALLQKRPMFLGSLLIVATSYHIAHSHRLPPTTCV